MKKLIETNIIIESPPFGTIAGKEGVDLALVCAAFDHKVRLIFVDQGVFHLLDSQDGNFFDDKLHDKQLRGLEYYDIEHCYAEFDCLENYSLSENHLIKGVELLNANEIRHLCDQAQQTVIF